MKLPVFPLLALLALAATVAATPARAQATVSAPGLETLPVELGHATVNASSYAVFATAPLNSPVKGQRLQFLTRESSAGSTSTAYTVVNTGQSKTLAQLAEILGVGLRRFASGGAAPGQEFAQVGDIRFGGELRLVAVDANGLRFAYNPPSARPTTFTRADAAAFATILGR